MIMMWTDGGIPEKMEWSAKDGGIINTQSRAFLISVWDHNNYDTLSLDLWTKEMSIEEMKIFFFQTMYAMAESFQKASGHDKMSEAMKDFADYFAKKMGIKTPNDWKFLYCFYDITKIRRWFF